MRPRPHRPSRMQGGFFARTNIPTALGGLSRCCILTKVGVVSAGQQEIVPTVAAT